MTIPKYVRFHNALYKREDAPEKDQQAYKEVLRSLYKVFNGLSDKDALKPAIDTMVASFSDSYAYDIPDNIVQIQSAWSAVEDALASMQAARAAYYEAISKEASHLTKGPVTLRQ